MSTQLEKINAFVDSIANNQLNERQQSLLLSSNPEGEIGGISVNKKGCINGDCPSASNGPGCQNTVSCTSGSNKKNCLNTGSCLVAPANQTLTCGGSIANLCTGINPCTVVANPCAVTRP